MLIEKGNEHPEERVGGTLTDRLAEALEANAKAMRELAWLRHCFQGHYDPETGEGEHYEFEMRDCNDKLCPNYATLEQQADAVLREWRESTGRAM